MLVGQSTLRGYAEAHPDHAHVITYGARRGGQVSRAGREGWREVIDKRCIVPMRLSGAMWEGA